MDYKVEKTLRKIGACFILLLFLLFMGGVFTSFISGMSLIDSFINVAKGIIIGQDSMDAKGIIRNAIPVILILLISASVLAYIFDEIVLLFLQANILGGAVRMTRLRRIKNHYIVCGAGRVGYHAAKQLVKAGEKVVLMEKDVEVIDKLKKKHKFVIIEGDCLDEYALRKARIEKAKGMICALGRNEDNLFLVVLAKHLNPEIKIATRTDDQLISDRMKHMGADVVITPEILGGYTLAEKILNVQKNKEC